MLEATGDNLPGEIDGNELQAVLGRLEAGHGGTQRSVLRYYPIYIIGSESEKRAFSTASTFKLSGAPLSGASA